MKTKQEIKYIKNHLSHLNEVYYYFKQQAKEENIEESLEKRYIQLLLKNYIQNDYSIISDDDIKRSKELLAS